MSNYSNNIMNSIDILTQSALRKLKYDITIKAIIKTIVDVKTGEYKVLYEGNLLSAFAKDDKTAYDINDTVYVKVPEGDFDNKLIIDYKLRGSDLSMSEIDELRNSTFEVSDDLLKDNNNFSKGLKITTGKDAEGNEFKCSPITIIDENFTKNFTYYSNKYEYIKIKATFRTNFIKTFVKGNYGLRFDFFSDETNSQYSYCLDSTGFNGNPYALMSESEQEVVIQIPTLKFNGSLSVCLYQNMENDYTKSPTVNNSNPINKDSQKYNIFVKDIKLFFMEKVDLFNLPYYFRVKALQGNDCAKRDLSFSPQLLSNGVEVSSNSTITWYEQDLTVDVASNNYDRAAGVGWKKIQTTVANPDNETAPCIYNNSLYVPENSIPQIKRFKVIATYDKSTFDKVIEVVNSAIINPYSLVYENDKLKVQNATGKSITWYYAVGTSTFAKIDDNKTDTLSLANYTKYINVKFYCVIDDTILEYDYTNEIVEEITVTYDGTSMFKYDASGKIDDTIYSSEYALTAKVAFQNGLSDKQYEIKWYAPDGNELVVTDQKHEIKNSMVTQARLDTKNSIRYNISSYYKQDSNNTFKIKIITADKEYSFEKEITFIKDGDQGTNGSACALVIKPVDGREYLYHNTEDNEKSKGLRLKVYLYNAKDNTSEDVTKDLDIKKIETYNVNCKYEETTVDGKIIDRIIHVNYEKGSGNEVKDYCYIKITYSVNNDPDIVLCYPIDVVINNTEDKKPTLDIAKYIKYDALGMNPICRREILGYTDEIITVTDVDTNTKTLVVDKKGYLSPNSHFPFDGTEGFLALKYNEDSVIHTIYFYKNSYGSTAINNWDGQKVHISDEKDKEQYILAPLIGAGTKSNSNFTGVVMGYDSSQGMGLYGYKDGTSSFGFKTDGTGYIGAKKKGRISFDGNSAMIFGGIKENDENSMTLNLYNDSNSKSTKAININDSDFYVDYDGNLFASKATIKGNITATSGKIGSWLINNNGLENGDTKLTSKGELIVKKGTIGPWSLTEDGLFYKSGNQKEYTTQLTKDQITISSIYIRDSATSTLYCSLGLNAENKMTLRGYSANLCIDSNQWTLFFKGTELQCDIPAVNQHGIYARFAD